MSDILPDDDTTPGRDAIQLWRLTGGKLTWEKIAQMPDEWQGRLASLLNEMDALIDQKKFLQQLKDQCQKKP